MNFRVEKTISSFIYHILKTPPININAVGELKKRNEGSQTIAYQPFIQKQLDSLLVKTPSEKAAAILSLVLQDESGKVLHRNFMSLIVEDSTTNITLKNGQKAKLLTTNANSFTESKWSQKQWNVLGGLKVNGAGTGFFEYKIKIPADLKMSDYTEASFMVEASAKQFFGKDREGVKAAGGDFMLGGGTNDPTSNPDSYQMTDEKKFSSRVNVVVNSQQSGDYDLPDDPDDHRGILSWHSQLHNKKLAEAGSYGYLIEAKLSKMALQKAIETGEFVILLTVKGEGGLAIYGQKMSRYPLF